ncbi:tyrosine-type recombinase/integrase [Pseudoxanthomonas daejeonensis]|uniref:tyrosine-type recombinase/integrase n=1 Tax=Pseudoxanthomonas daejeonensis TaxID=266062 RepID=UPI001F53E871|nr:tyrosine-type recombinase/integrase [Pseudoxanthomonas daejeonensis]UNK57168.1 tyrosine-type recombinase/integrase [Pseudoxanthomonas daejeonensis]
MSREDIDKVGVRNRLQVRREPYWGPPVERGLYVGFRRLSLGGNWVARFRTEDGKQVYQSLGPASAEHDYESAKREARRWRKTVDAGVQADRLVTVADVCRDYTAAIEAEGRTRAAVDARKRFDRIVYADPIGKVRADKLTQRHLEAWALRMEAGEMTGRKKALPSRATLNRNLTTLKAALNRAVSRREIPQDRAIEWGAIKPHKGAGVRRERYLDKAQRRALLEAMPCDLRALAECVALTGCRPGDPAAMLRKDWDARHGLATFTTKTGARTVPVSPPARSLFDRLAKSKLPGAPMFTNGDAAWTPQAWAPQVKAAAARAELPSDVVLYTLRHAWITDAIIGGLDPVTVARLTGTSLEMISKHYGHLAQDAARDKLASLAFL